MVRGRGNTRSRKPGSHAELGGRRLDQRAENKTRKVRHEFSLTCLVRCGHCGCLMVGELKKGRYVYYHCTGNRGRCAEPYVREERLAGEFGHRLADLVIEPQVLSWLERTAAEMDRSEQSDTEQLLRRLKADYDRLQARIEVMYMDRLDGRIDTAFFDPKTADWRREQKSLQWRMEQMKTTGVRSATEAVGMMRSISQTCERFVQQPQAEQRNVISTLVKAASWKGGELQTVLAEPYEIMPALELCKPNEGKRESGVRVRF